MWGLNPARNVMGSVPAVKEMWEYQENANEEVCV